MHQIEVKVALAACSPANKETIDAKIGRPKLITFLMLLRSWKNQIFNLSVILLINSEHSGNVTNTKITDCLK